MGMGSSGGPDGGDVSRLRGGTRRDFRIADFPRCLFRPIALRAARGVLRGEPVLVVAGSSVDVAQAPRRAKPAPRCGGARSDTRVRLARRSSRSPSDLAPRGPGHGMDFGLGRVFRRPALRRAKARPVDQPGEDLGRRRGCLGRGRALRARLGGFRRSRMDPSPPARPRGGRYDWRSVRISDKTPGGSEGQRYASPRARRNTRSDRRARGDAAAGCACVHEMSKIQNIAILGATGSIGASTLDVIARHPSRFRVVALTANRQVDELAELCRRHRPDVVCVADASRAPRLRERLASAGASCRVLAGEEGLVEIASLPGVDCVMAAIVGAAGLRATLAAAKAGKKLLLANKEALVVAGPVFMETVRASGAVLLPIDSEHNAIFQCLPPFAAGDLAAKGIRRILLTGSGGPFRARARKELHRVTLEEACAHPNWVMGRKISVDSATMMNKGLEIIEAHWLFGAAPEQIQVVVHPQSVVHSMVEYADGSVIAQLGHPDMRTPIAQALAYPER